MSIHIFKISIPKYLFLFVTYHGLLQWEEGTFSLKLWNPSVRATLKSVYVHGIFSHFLAQAPGSLLSLAFGSGGFLEYPKASVQLSLGECHLT